MADRIVMLALSPDSGRPQNGLDHGRLQRALVAALVAELMLMRRLHVDARGVITVSDRLPTTHPLLRESADFIARLGDAEQVERALDMLSARMGRLWPRLADGLFRRDLLHRGVKLHFLVWPRRVYPLRSQQGRNECLALLEPADPGTPSAVSRHMLLTLLSAAGILDVLPEHERSPQLSRRGLDAVSQAISESVRDPLQAFARTLARYVRG